MGTPMEELGEGVKEPKGFATPWEEQEYQPTRPFPPPPELPGTKPPKNTHGSSCICGRGWPCLASKGGEALGPEKA
jgi:hypothetical protein